MPKVRLLANSEINPIIGDGEDVNNLDNLMVEVDGEEVYDVFAYRAQSPAGGFLWQAGPLQEAFGLAIQDRDAATDGFWILLKPLSIGVHTIHFAGTVPGADFELDITYVLTVVPSIQPLK